MLQPQVANCIEWPFTSHLFNLGQLHQTKIIHQKLSLSKTIQFNVHPHHFPWSINTFFFFLNVGPLQEDIFSGHLLSPIFHLYLIELMLSIQLENPNRPRLHLFHFHPTPTTSGVFLSKKFPTSDNFAAKICHSIWPLDLFIYFARRKQIDVQMLRERLQSQ